MASRSGQNHLLHDGAGILRILLQILRQCLAHGLIHSGRNLVVAELGFGLTLKLRLRNLHRNYGRQTLAEVVTTDLKLELGEHARIVGILLQCAGQGTTETREVGTTLDRIDVVYIRVYVLRERVVVLHGHLDGHALRLGVEVDDLVDDLLTARLIQVLHELLQTLLRIEVVLTQLAILIGTHVVEIQVNTLVQEGQLAQTRCQNVVAIDGRMGKDLRVGMERNGRTTILAFADYLDLRDGLTLAIRLAENLTLAVNLGNEQGRKCIHARYTHTVQTTRHLVAALVELTTGVEYGHNDLQCRFLLLLVHAGRNTATVIAYGDRVVLANGYVNRIAVASQRLVDRVVDHLINQVVQTLLANVTDVHGRTFTHCLQTLQDLDVGRAIFFLLALDVLLFCTHL